ncbi:hypothetical protein HDU96_001800, partial [Phlyctochytrium bullatum]
MGETVKSAFKAAGLTLPVYGKNVTHYWFRKIGLTQAMRYGASKEDVEYVGWTSHTEAMKTYYGDGTPEAFRHAQAGFYKYEAYIIPRQEAHVPEELRKKIFPFLSEALAAKVNESRNKTRKVLYQSFQHMTTILIQDLASLYNRQVLDGDHFVWKINPFNTAQFKEFAKTIQQLEDMDRSASTLGNASGRDAAPAVLQCQESIHKQVVGMRGQIAQLDVKLGSSSGAALGPRDAGMQGNADLLNHEINRLRGIIVTAASHAQEALKDSPYISELDSEFSRQTPGSRNFLLNLEIERLRKIIKKEAPSAVPNAMISPFVYSEIPRGLCNVLPSPARNIETSKKRKSRKKQSAGSPLSATLLSSTATLFPSTASLFHTSSTLFPTTSF